MIDKNIAIKAINIDKTYKMYKGSGEKLKDLISPKGAGKKFNALKNISFEVEKGQCVGLIGLNGAGKSTLSNILAGVSMPTEGEIIINGNPAIIAIGSGLNNFLTGMENIEVKALMMGFKKEKIEEIKKDVIEFAEIGEFINQPIRTYSSGMRSRLGFAISIHMDTDILVIDEALSVGDQTFTRKCLNKMNEFKKENKTIFFVSHSIGQVRDFCDKVIWLEYGHLRDYGEAEDIIGKYNKYLKEINEMSKVQKEEYKKRVLKDKNHSLLEKINVVDSKYRELLIRDKFLGTTILVKNKKIKILPYKFDCKTAILGGIRSLLRKEYSTGIFICILEAILLFIGKGINGLLIRTIFTVICALVINKRYSNKLIDEGYIPYEKQTSVVLEKKDIKKAIKKLKKEFLVYVLTIAIIGIGMIGIDFIRNENLKINNQIALVIKYEEKIKEVALIDVNDKGIKVERYSDLKVKNKGKEKKLTKYIDDNGSDVINIIFKDKERVIYEIEANENLLQNPEKMYKEILENTNKEKIINKYEISIKEFEKIQDIIKDGNITIEKGMYKSIDISEGE